MSDWSSYVCSSDIHLAGHHQPPGGDVDQHVVALAEMAFPFGGVELVADQRVSRGGIRHPQQRFGQAHQHQPFLGVQAVLAQQRIEGIDGILTPRSEEHTSELQSLMRISYAVLCLKKNK